MTEQKKGTPQGEKEGNDGEIGDYVNHPVRKECAGRGRVYHTALLRVRGRLKSDRHSRSQTWRNLHLLSVCLGMRKEEA